MRGIIGLADVLDTALTFEGDIKIIGCTYTLGV